MEGPLHGECTSHHGFQYWGTPILGNLGDIHTIMSENMAGI
jgi:hypothetical protein